MLRGSILRRGILLIVAVAILVQLGVIRPIIRKFIGEYQTKMTLQTFNTIAHFFDVNMSKWGNGGLATFKDLKTDQALAQFDWWLLDENLKPVDQGQPGEFPRSITKFQLTNHIPQMLESEFLGNLVVAGRLPSFPNKILVVGRAPENVNQGKYLQWMLLGSAVVWVSFTLGFSFLFFVLYMRKKASEARSVLQHLKDGHLSARFEVKRADEVSQLMLEFNSMADEVQQLIGALREHEKDRAVLVQQLGHDLRTPLTAVQVNLEMLHDHHSKLSVKERTELLQIALGEMKYLIKLLDDLFLVASVSSNNQASLEVGIHGNVIQFDKLISQEIAHFKQLCRSSVVLRARIQSNSVVVGNEKLLQRLIRNLLENALRFASSEIIVTSETTNKKMVLCVRDNGPGFSNEALHNFGKRTNARTLASLANREGSTGMGSVIARSIAAFHAAELTVGNWTKDNGEVGGAEIKVAFPLTRISVSYAA